MSSIILFDGICNLCNSSVNFIINRDSNDVFKFASLQSASGKKLLDKFGLNSEEFNSIVLIEGDKYFTKSTAVLRVARELKGLWKLLYVFILIPAPIRNFFYDIVSKSRYKWFGKKDSCRAPTPDLKEKFL